MLVFFITIATAFSLLFLLLLLAVFYVYLRLSVGRCRCNTYLAGKTALITGGNSGLGYQTALALAGRGCRVIIADKENCDKTREGIIKETGNSNVISKYFDLASLSSIRKLAKEIVETEDRLDILINNAGTSGLGNAYTEDDLHIGMQVNHFGSFLLTHLLIGLLKKSTPSRIIFVSSWLAFINDLVPRNLNYPKDVPATIWSDIMVYANSKLCNIITAKELSKKLSGTGVTVNSLHPGLVYTPIFSKYAEGRSVNILFQWLFDNFILKCFAKSTEEGAQTTIHLALTKEAETVTGKYFSDCQVFMEPTKAEDRLFSKQIWEASEEYVKLAPEELL